MNIHTLLRIGGTMIVVLSLVFVGQQLFQFGLTAPFAEAGGGLPVAIALGSLVYAAAVLITALAWARIVADRAEAHRWQQVAIYGTSQIAKYAPGNVFHFIGRHAAGRNLGLPHGTLVWATAIEAFGLLLAAGAWALGGWLVGGVLESVSPSKSSGYFVVTLGLAAAIFFFVCIGGAVWIGLGPILRWAIKFPIVRRLPSPALAAIANAGPGSRLLPAYLMYVGFFAVSGCVVWLIGGLLVSLPALAIFHVVSVAAAAWVIGFAVPGAGAGIGVREAVIILGLTGLVGGAAAAMIAVTYRIATIIGDLLFFCVALYLRQQFQQRD